MITDKDIHLDYKDSVAWQMGWDKGYKAGYNQAKEELTGGKKA